MENSQLFNILKSLDKTEFREFGKFVRSPFFNNRSEIVRFYDAIKIFYPNFKSKEFTEEKIFSLVYPGRKSSGVLMRKLVSLTTHMVLNYFAITGFMENKFEYNVKLIDKLRVKKLPALFDKKTKNIDELFINSKRSIDYYESKFKYTSIVNGHNLNINEKSMVNRLQNEIDEFLEYFLIVVLLLYIRLGEWSRGLNIKFDLRFYDAVLNYYSSGSFSEVTLATLYYNMLMLLDTEDEKYFFELLKNRKKFEDKLSDSDDYNIGIVSMQYCYKRVQKGDAEYRKHQFEITKIIIKKNLIPAGYIEPYFFTNAVRNASNIKEIKWAEEFVNDNKARLNPDFADEITGYSIAMIECARGNFDKSLKYLSKINIERSNMKLDIKNLLIVIYFELNYFEELVSLLDTYKHFLNRDKAITEKSRQLNLIFTNFVSNLVKIRLNEKNESAGMLIKEIENTPYFSFKDWLLQKAGEMYI